MRKLQLVSGVCLAVAGLVSSGCDLVIGLDNYTDQPTGNPGSGGDAATGTGASGGDGGHGAMGGTPSQGGGGDASGAGGDGGVPSTGGNGGEPSTGGEGGEGGSPAVCDQVTHVCVEAPPVEWTGPVALYTGPAADTPPACAGAYPDDAGEFNGGFNPGNASCDCNCSAAQGIQCTSSATLCYTSNCNLICNATNAVLPPGQCTSISTGSTSAKVSNPAPTNVGSCQPSSNHSLPTPTWATAAVACDGAVISPGECGGGDLCAPRAFAPIDKLCIVHAGDVDCPAGSAYSEEHLLFDDFTDTRTCSTCGCGTASSTCGGDVDFVRNSCTILEDVVPAGGCGTMGSPTGAIYGPSPSGTCPETGGALSGAAAETGPVTYCCLP